MTVNVPLANLANLRRRLGVTPPRRMATVVALTGAVALGAGCASTPKYSEDIGVRRVGLSLAFKDEALAKPVPPNIIIQLIPAPPELTRQAVPDLTPFMDTTPRPLPSVPRKPLKPFQLPCPAAPADAAPDAPAPLVIVKPPKEGKYRRFNTGTVKVTTATLSLTLPYPFVTTMEVKNVKSGMVASAIPGGAPTPLTTFQVIETLTQTSTVTESYQFNDKELDLVSRSTKNDFGATVINPSPPLKVYDFAGFGTNLAAAGVDAPNAEGIAVQGKVSKSHVVDLCGTVIDTVETATQTTISNLADPTASGGTQPGATDLTAVATQLGGLFARREFHTTEIVNANGTPVTVTYDVVSTLGQTVPGGF